MAQPPDDSQPTASEAATQLKNGNIEPIARYIETGNVATLFDLLGDEGRQRLARALRTGSPLTMGEKRENSRACKLRDRMLLERLFYWFGRGSPGFSHTATDTAFHLAVKDYEKTLIKGAPSRTAESLYRHVWKKRLSDLRQNNLAENDFRGVKMSLVTSFIYGLLASKPTIDELSARLDWFESSFLISEFRFYVSHNDVFTLSRMLKATGKPGARWSSHIKADHFTSPALEELFRI